VHRKRDAYRLQIWGISNDKTISPEGDLVDAECLIQASNENEALREAGRRIIEYTNNIRFHLINPADDTVTFLCRESPSLVQS